MSKIIFNKNNNTTLWLGDMENGQDELFLKQNNIGTVFNITPLSFIKYNNITYFQIPLNDSDSHKSIKKFINSISVIDDINDQLINTNVLVHCQMGMQRSAAIIVAYLMKYYDMNMDKGIDYVISKRSIAFKYRVTFLEGLCALDN